MSLAGEEQTTPTHEATTNPQFATSVAFPKLKLPTHPELSAPLNLSVYDNDKWCVPFSAPFNAFLSLTCAESF